MARKTPLRTKTALKASGRKRKHKKKRLTTGQLKKRTWKEFSIFIRTRGADAEGFVCCATCGVKKHWKEIQAGHFIAGRLNSNLFDERGVHPQCGLCNVVKKGNGPKYYQFMESTYGKEVIDELMRQNDQTHKWLPGELESIWHKYRDLNATNPLLSEADG